MKSKFFTKMTTVLLSLIIVMSSAVCVSAFGTDSKIDTDSKGSLTLTYKSGAEKLNGLDIQAFRVASVSPNAQYTLTPAFEGYPIDVNAVTSQDEWNSVTATLNAYITADSIAPTKQGTTNSDGVVSFEYLDMGLYLIRRANNGANDDVTGFDPFIVSVPTLDDSGHESERPSKVDIKVSKNGNPFKTQSVTAGDNWTYKWNAVDDGSEWTVVESGMGDKYNVNVTKSGNIFTIINHYKTDGSGDGGDGGNGSGNGKTGDDSYNPLRTGDDSHADAYALMLLLSGLVLICVGFAGGRKREDA